MGLRYCCTCGKLRDMTGVDCRRCAARHNRRKERRAAEWRSEGRCYRCGRERFGDLTVCEHHYLLRRSAALTRAGMTLDDAVAHDDDGFSSLHLPAVPYSPRPRAMPAPPQLSEGVFPARPGT